MVLCFKNCSSRLAAPFRKIPAAAVSLSFCLIAALLITISPISTDSAVAEANVRVDVTPSRGTIDNEYELRVVLDGSNLDSYGDPFIEEDERFTIEQGGVMRHQVYINGKGGENKVFTFYLSPSPGLKPGRYRIPAISFKAGGKEFAVNEPDIEILAGSANPRTRTSETKAETGNIDFTQSVNETRPYVGQQVLYRTEMVSTKPITSGVVSDIPFDGFWHEPFGKAKEDLRQVNQTMVRTYESSEAIFANRAGEIAIPPRVLTAELQVAAPRRSSRGDPWDTMRYGGIPDPFDIIQQTRTVKKKYTTKALTLTALPLPPVPAGMPRPSYIPVGQLSLVAMADRFDAKVGDSISYSIDITGNANLRPVELPQPEGKDLDKFKIYPDQAEVKTFPGQDSISFKKRFPVSLIPRAAGTFELPGYSFVAFEPTRGQFNLLTTPRRTITVGPAEGAQGLAVLPDRANQPAAGQEKSDLLPQYTGPSAYLPAAKPSKALLYFLVLIYPAFMVLLRLIISGRKRLEGNELLVRQKRALENFNRRLAAILPESTSAPSDLNSAVRIYLGDKFGFAGESATVGELLKLTEATLLSDSLRTDLGGLLRDLERTEYGGGGLESGPFSAIKLRAAEVAKKVEQEVRT